LESFYETSWNRALEFFEKHHVKATFFVVGDELENSTVIKNIILKAHRQGHEIENHTYSHPYGLATLTEEAIVDEIDKCNKVIEKITARTPVGFRSPGYSINTNIINILERLGLAYDSSGFWSIMNPVLQCTHKLFFKKGIKNAGFGQVTSKLFQQPYRPDPNNWLASTHSRRFLELPLPRTPFFNLPFYHNFNLWAPALYTNLVSQNINRPFMVYLFHIIEFVDLGDNIPAALAVHPNLKKTVKEKIRFSDRILYNLSGRYEVMTTRSFVENRQQETPLKVPQAGVIPQGTLAAH
jgi:peptidoglycan-N-acetylglucosamine deacetylase